MPGFVKSPKDEARWSKAKSAASKSKNKDEKSFDDQDWALVNHIYHQINKNDNFKQIKDFLEKARRKLSDEPFDPYEDDQNDDYSEEKGFSSINPENEDDEAEKWLKENEPEKQQEYEEPVDEQESEERLEPQKVASPQETGGSSFEEKTPSTRFPQPSKEEISDIRQYTRPWEQNARERNALEAQAHNNPVLYHQGKLIESRNAQHADRQKAYEDMQSSLEYKNASAVKRMRMDQKFHKDWAEKNPDQTRQALESHAAAHRAGAAGKDIHSAAEHEKILHALTGGAQAESPMSLEAAMQHAGGTKEEDGTTGSITQDKAASFAAGNKEFLRQYAKHYAEKNKKPSSMEDMANYDERSKADITRILGDHPALKNPEKKAKVDSFFEKYHPLIAMNATKVLNKLGIDRRSTDLDLGVLDEAGMHGLFQAVNDYDHDHPSKASFSTHAGNKIRGLMQTALRNQDVVSQKLRTSAKRFAAQPKTEQTPQVSTPTQVPKTSPMPAEQPKTQTSSKDLISKHPQDVASRYHSINTNRKIILKPGSRGDK